MSNRAKLSLNTAPAAQRSEETEQHIQRAASPAQVSSVVHTPPHARPSRYGPADILTMQRTVGNQAVGRLLARSARHPPVQKAASTELETGMNHDRGDGQPLDNVSGLVQRYPTQDDDGRLDALIYVISENDLDKPIYVGQTTDKRAGDRFLEHVKKDAWAPWWVDNGLDYSVAESKWPYRVRTLEALKEVTKFETTVAEQWWLEQKLKQGHKLLNDSTPCTLENFTKRSTNKSLYDPKNIGVTSSWKPSMKAK